MGHSVQWDVINAHLCKSLQNPEGTQGKEFCLVRGGRGATKDMLWMTA